MKSSRKYLLLSIILIGLMQFNIASAFEVITCANGQPLKNPNNNVTFNIHPNSFPQSVPPNPYTNALNEVRSSISRSSADISINYQYSNTNASVGNGVSEVYFSTDPSNTPTVTWFFPNLANCTFGNSGETDVVFWTGIPWTASKNISDIWQYGGSSRNIHNTALHEFGHVFAMQHENDLYNMMGQDWSHSHVDPITQQIVPYLGDDLNQGLRALYGNRNFPIEDVSLAHWDYSGISGEYSTHARSRITDLTGNTLPSDNPLAPQNVSISIQNEPFFHVSRGQTVKVELMFENNGQSNHFSVPVRFFTSQNPNVTISESYWNIGPGNPSTVPITITIPTNLATGFYHYIGATIDPDNNISEIDENNTVYVGIRVIN